MSNWYRIFSVGLILVSACYTVPCISEVMSREEMVLTLESQLRQLSAKALEINQRVFVDLNENRLRSIDEIKERQSEYKDLVLTINRLQNLSSRVRTLVVGGSISRNDSLDTIALEYHNLINAYDTSVKAQVAVSAEPKPISWMIENRRWLWVWLWPIYHMRSTYLLALAAILSGTIGSLVAGLRRPKDVDFYRNIALGIATGFIAFLLIRGGKSVFFLHSGEHIPPLNPYSATLSSLLGGLFTGKVFHLLAYLADEFIYKVKALSTQSTDEIKRKSNNEDFQDFEETE